MENKIENKVDGKKYLIVFLITIGIFVSVFYLSNYFGNKKINQLKLIKDQITIDILSSEVQFSLLQESSCKNISDSILTGELNDLARKLEWGEENLSATKEISYLKKYYSLLQIKDYLLMKKISTRCGLKSAFILYFYTNAENCNECKKQAIVLSALRNKYPELRVYSFDYSIALSAISAMLDIYKIEDTKLPALVIDDDVLIGFNSIEELKTRIEKSFDLSDLEKGLEKDLEKKDPKPKK
ncbi:MAG: hypothetical protein AAB693_02200 [Patescibacteria group bacterium]